MLGKAEDDRVELSLLKGGEQPLLALAGVGWVEHASTVP
jgi:hypothetical protein